MTSVSETPSGSSVEELRTPISALPAGRALEIVTASGQTPELPGTADQNPLGSASLPAFSKKKAVAATKVSNEELFRAVTKTLPLEIELLRPLRYRVPLNGGTFDILILKLAVPGHKEESLDRWRLNFESEYGIRVLVERSRTFSGIREQLGRWADGSDALDGTHIPRLDRYLKGFFGRPPALPQRLTPPPGLRDLSRLRFMGIDPQGTSSHEDLLYAAPGSSPGAVRLMIALIDVTHFAQPGNYIDRYAGRIGGSIFGSRICIPTLGPQITNGPASFLPGELRPCWLVEVELSAEGAVLERAVGRALVKNHCQLAPEEANNAADLETSLTLGYLKQAAERLYARRVKQKKIILVESEGLGGLIVGESMVAAKAALAEFMLEHNLPAIFRTHTPPTPERKQELMRQGELSGIRISAETFDDPVQFAALLQKLEGDPTPGAQALLQETLDVYFTRSRFDTVNHGHFGIGVGAYLEIKPRDATGLANQYQLARYFSGSGRLLPQGEMERRSARRNRQLRERISIEYKLRFYEKLRENLAQSGLEFEGIIRERHPDHALVEMPGFTKWGVLPVDGQGTKAGFDVETCVRARMQRFSLKHMRFVFAGQA